MRLFLCDDNPEYRTLARHVLQSEHTIVGEAGDGVQALEQAPPAEPDVLLLDLNMPRLSGYDALPRLRDALPGTKVIVLTSGGSPDERRRAFDAGAHGFITKPSSVFTLADELTAALADPPAG